jgi:DNA topoisomerase-1
MLRMMLPIHAKVVGKLDEGGRYERRYIEVSLTAGERPEMLAKILAHEMGHHIYKVYLGQKDRTFWDTAIRGNYGPIDIDKALRLWPDGAWIHEMGELLKDVDPTLAIQLELLGFGHGEVREIRKKEDFEAAVARGDTFAVPQNPVTGYAGKNPEEAFCEALGMLIGYGPRTVDPLIRHWVQMILPNLRVAGLRIAKRGGIDRTIQKAALGRSLLSAQVVASFEFSPMRRHCERPYMQMREGPESRGQSCLGQGNSSSVWWPMIDAKTVVARYKAKRESDKGNTIYLYSERQVALRNNKKAERIAKLGKALKKLRAQVKRDLKSSDPETKLTALAVALMDHTYERVGNDESASEGHFGVTGWQRRHVSFKSDGALIRYTGKSGVKHEKRVTDAGIRKALREAYNSLEGDDTCVLSWDDGCVTAEKVNAYLEPFGATAKDIRGYHANDEVRSSLRQTRTKGGPLPKDKAKKAEQLKKEFKDAVELAAAKVGHEPTTLNSQYLIPGLEDTYLKDGKIL